MAPYGYQQQPQMMAMDQRKRAAAGRKVIDSYGDQFMAPADKSLQ